MLIRAAIAGAMLAGLAACATPTPYQPAIDTPYGFAEQRIEPDRYRVTFSGNTITDRETVENYLLLRAAELTLQQGYEYFRVVTRDTDAETRQYATSAYPGYGFNAHYRYYHPRYGWYGPYSPFFNDVEVRESTRYQAIAEIKFGPGPYPDAANVFNAREVARNLSQVQRPAY